MAERSAVTQVIQVGIETTVGTSVAAMKRMAAMDIETKIETTTDMFRPAGFKFSTVTSENKEWTTGSIKGQPTYSEIVWPLSSVIVTPAAPTEFLDTAIHTGVWKWIFEPNSTTPDTLNTWTVEQGSSVRAQKFTNGIVTDFNLNITRDKAEMTGKMVGQLFTDAITLTTTRADAAASATSGSPTVNDAAALPSDVGKTVTGTQAPANAIIDSVVPGVSFHMATVVNGVVTAANALGTGTFTATIGAPPQMPLIPITAEQCTVYFDPTSAALGTTKLSRLFDFKFALTGRTGPFWVVDASLPSFAGTTELAPKTNVKVTVEADANGMALLPLLRSGTTYFMRLLAQGATLYSVGVYSAGAALKYQYQQDMAVQVTAAGAVQDHEGIYAIEFDLEVVHDPTWGKAIHIEVQNRQFGF
jgi:hypothetical protein